MSETVTVYFAGREVGRLKIDLTSPDDYISLQAAPGVYEYELEAWMLVQDANGQSRQLTAGGQGTIEVYDGAIYTIVYTPRGSGFDATLRQQSSI